MAIPQTITLRKDALLNGGGGPPLEAAVTDEESNLLDGPSQSYNYGGGETNNNRNENGRVNTNHETANGGGPTTVKPMDHLELSRRRHLCWSVSLLTVFLGCIGFLAVWRFQHQVEHPAMVTLAGRAEHARQVLNKHLKRQSQVVAPGCEGTILLLRHCEKYGPNVVDEDNNQHCSYVGRERAHYLKTLFQAPNNDNATTKARWPTPSYLFALTPDRGSHWNFRQVETLQPLAAASRVDVTVVPPLDLPPRLFSLLQSGALCGRLAVVAWKHEYLPALATALGCGPEQGCPTSYPDFSFDQVWQLKYVFDPTSVSSLSQEAQQERHWQDETQQQEQAQQQESAANGNDNGGPHRRHLKHHNKKKDNKDRKKNDGWFVYGSVQHQNFDPLAYSASVGDYAVEGRAAGGRWKAEDEM